MTDFEIADAFERDGYVVVEDFIDDRDLEPMRSFIQAKVDTYAHQQYDEGKISSLYEDASFERRYAAICEEMDMMPRSWGLGAYGCEYYDLYTLPSILHVVGLILGYEVSSLGTASLRTKLPGSMITSFPWHQDSQYVDQTKIGQKEKNTAHLPMLTVWVPLVEATIENGCCWVLPGSHRWGLLDGARGEDMNIRMEEDVEARGVSPVAVPLKPGGALFISNLCVHTSKLNTTKESRWSIDFRYFPTPDRADLTPQQNKEAEFVQNKPVAPLVVLSEGHTTSWEAWEAKIFRKKKK